MITTYGPERVRELNSLAILSHLRTVPNATVTQIATATGLSRTSVGTAIAEVEDMGWVQSLPPQSPAAGRPAKRYQFAAEAALIAGVDIGANRVGAVVIDLTGTIVAAHEIALSPSASAAARVAATLDTLATVCAAPRVPAEKLAVISVALTGPVDDEGGTPFGNSLPGWDTVNIRQEIAAIYPCPIMVENDCKCALLAEAQIGQARGLTSAVYVMAGARIGAAFMLDGHVCRGAGGAAGEIGALPALHWNNAPELFLTHSHLPPSLPTRRAAQWVCDRARDGEKEAARIISDFSKDLALGAAALTLTIDPQVMIVGGGISASADLWIDEFTARLQSSVLHMPEVRVSTLGSRAVVVGAARRGLDDVNARALGDQLLPPESLLPQ